MDNNIMNPPVELEWGPAEIVLAYNDSLNTKKVAKMYCITDKEVKEILKKAKIKILPVKEKIVSDAEQALNDIGMSQKDFYKS
nr:hypothetical protein [uncultured Eisenbergiella sp.]